MPRWQRQAASPLVVWIASPENSGIEFIDSDHPERPCHHILVKFALPPGDDSRPLSARVEYEVNPRAPAGNHSFWLEIYGQLTAADRTGFQDMGATRLPFEVIPISTPNS